MMNSYYRPKQAVSFNLALKDLIDELEACSLKSSVDKPMNTTKLNSLGRVGTITFKGKFVGEKSETYSVEIVAPGLDAATIEVSIEKDNILLMKNQPTMGECFNLKVKAQTLEGNAYSYQTILSDLDDYYIRKDYSEEKCKYEAGIIYVPVPVQKINRVVYSAKVEPPKLEKIAETIKNDKANLSPQDA